MSLNYDQSLINFLCNAYDFKNYDYVRIVKYIIDLLSVNNFTSSDVNDVVDRFYYILYDTINNIMFVPNKRVYSSSHKIWYSNTQKSLLKEKKNYHLVYNKYNNDSDYVSFSHLRLK